MPISTEIQNKVLEIASNPDANQKVKLAVRKRFYELKNEEIKIEEFQTDFDENTSLFEKQLDDLNKQLKAVVTAEIPVMPTPVQVQEPVVAPLDEEEIVLPKKEEQIVSGVKVRMQEEVDNTEAEDTDFEVPFEANE